MKAYIKQTTTIYTQGDGFPKIEPPDGYYLAFAEVRGDNWHLIWAPLLT